MSRGCAANTAGQVLQSAALLLQQELLLTREVTRGCILTTEEGCLVAAGDRHPARRRFGGEVPQPRGSCWLHGCCPRVGSVAVLCSLHQ